MTIAAPDAYEVDTNLILRVSASDGLLANDIFDLNVPFEILVQVDPDHGSLTLGIDGSFTYIPEVGYAGIDTFSYVIRRDGEPDIIGEATIAVEGDLVREAFDHTLSSFEGEVIQAQSVALPGGGFAVLEADLSGATLRARIGIYDEAGVLLGRETVDTIDASAAAVLPQRYLDGILRLVDAGGGKLVAIIEVGYGGFDPGNPDDPNNVPISVWGGNLRVVWFDTETGTQQTLLNQQPDDFTYSTVNGASILTDGRFMVVSSTATFSEDGLDATTNGQIKIFGPGGSLDTSATYRLGSDASDYLETLNNLVALPLADGGALLHTSEGVFRMSPTGGLSLVAPDALYNSEDEHSGIDITLVGESRFAVVYTIDESETPDVIYELRGLDGSLIASDQIGTSGLAYDDSEIAFDIAALDDGTQLVVWANDNDEDGQTPTVVIAQLYSVEGERIGGVMRLGSYIRTNYVDEPPPLVISDGTAFLVLVGDNTGVVIDASGFNYGPFRLTGEDPSATVVRAELAPDGQILLQWNDGARFIRLPEAPTELFTAGPDIVDFNNLGPRQIAILEALSSADSNGVLEHALSGNDTVFLPDIANYDVPGELAWQPLNHFYAGAGNDTISGGNGYDWVDAGSGDDIIVGSLGIDTISGGEGEDKFDFSLLDFSTFELGTIQSLDGGTHPEQHPFGLQDHPDVLLLSGSPDDYVITADFTGFSQGQPVHFRIRESATNPGQRELDVVNIELVRFAQAVENQVSLWGNNLVLELIRLAGESYGALETLDHLAEPLASTGSFAAWAAAGVAAEATRLRHWHALSALELGIPAAYTHPQTGLQYSLTNGHYQAIDPSPLGIGDTPEANALVLVGVVNGVTTLALAFRGTDQFADFADYPDFTLDHYAKFNPLIDAIDAYVADPANGIQQVLVSGHSLGAGMVQEFMSDHAGSLYQAVTIGSPGSDNNDGIEDDPRIVNFAHTSDAVAMIAPALSQAAPILSAWLLLQGQVTLAAIIGKIQPKDRDGSDVYINSDIAAFPGITEHAWTNYLASVTTILERAVAGPFSLHPFAAALRAGLVYSGDDVQIAIGQPGSSKITSWTGDNFVLGSSAADSIEWSGVTPLGEYRVIDAGLGSDELILPGLKASWGWDNLGGHYALSFLGLDVGQLWNVEKLIFTFFSHEELQQAKTAFAAAEPAPVIPVVYLNGQAASVQQAVPGASVLNVDPDVDYVETGNSTLMVNGSADNDIIMLGGGNQTIDGGAGNDVVNAINAANGGGVFAVTGGGGDDLVIGSGGARMTAVFSGNAADYGADERVDGGIILTDLRPGSPDGEDTLLQVVTLRFADGDITAAQFLAERVPVLLQGTDDDDALIPARDGTVIAIGLAGDDCLEGGARPDLLDGGTGADHLYGHAGDDMYLVNQLADIVFEGDDEGTDTVTASGNFYLYANIENLVQAAGAGAIFGVGNDLANTITGNESDNLLLGGAGNDAISGNTGGDTLFGEGGDDVLGGGDGVDYLIGGTGNDVLSGGNATDALYGEDGNDTLTGGADFATDIFYGGGGDDVLHGNSGQGDYDILNGAAGNETYYVDTPDDVIYEGVGEGTDTVYADIQGAGYYLWYQVENCTLLGTTPFAAGNESNNVLIGSASDNWLLGNGGNDTLNGKGGNDVLFGDRPGEPAGNDVFVFDGIVGIDIVGDFHAGEDKIQLVGLYADFATAIANFRQVGSDCALDLPGGNMIIFHSVQYSTLSASDFLFG